MDAIGNKLTILDANIENRIYNVRNTQVMIDLDLASLYGVENRSLRQTVRRNRDSFPSDFMFVLTRDEANELINNGVSRSVIPEGYNTGGATMYAFTEQGIAMLASILKSPNARTVSIAIMRAFVAMRHFMLANAQVFQRLERIEYKQFETEQKLDLVFAQLDSSSLTPQPKLFFEGQIFDAYEFICDLIRSAKFRIVLIDNYVDDSVLTILDKRSANVTATIYTQQASKQLNLDLAKHNAQYPAISVRVFKNAHDRFLILDDRVYLVGASIKDVGKKWFGISPMPRTDVNDLLSRL